MHNQFIYGLVDINNNINLKRSIFILLIAFSVDLQDPSTQNDNGDLDADVVTSLDAFSEDQPLLRWFADIIESAGNCLCSL